MGGRSSAHFSDLCDARCARCFSIFCVWKETFCLVRLLELFYEKLSAGAVWCSGDLMKREDEDRAVMQMTDSVCGRPQFVSVCSYSLVSAVLHVEYFYF